MTNLAEAFRVKPEIKEDVEKIVWYNDNIHPSLGTNYEFDKKAGLKTSAVFFGPKKIMQLMYFLNIVLVILMIILFIISIFELTEVDKIYP